MTKHDKQIPAPASVTETFGSLSLVMLDDSDLRHAWRLNFVANFFTGPVYRQIAEQFGVTRPEFVILYCLKHVPGLVARDVCRVTGQPKNSISRAVSDLLKKGYIDRDTDPTDKRAKPLSLSAEGAKVLDQVAPVILARQESMRQALSDDELKQFDALIRKVIFAMPEWVTPDQH